MKKYLNLTIFITLGIVSIVSYIWFINHPLFENFILWAQQNLILYICVLILVKIIGIIWPPLPASLITVGSIPVIGWFYAYIADATGSLVGGSIAYYLGRKYGFNFLNKLFDKNIVEKIVAIKINKDKEFEAIVIMRLLYGSITELISYGAGLIGVSYGKFIAGTFVAIMFGLPVFYLIENVIHKDNAYISLTILIVAVLSISKLKKRYFE